MPHGVVIIPKNFFAKDYVQEHLEFCMGNVDPNNNSLLAGKWIIGE